MATLIPAFNSCKPRMTTGERRLAERLEAKLEDDYLLWYDVPLGTSGFHPDFMVLHPRRGLRISCGSMSVAFAGGDLCGDADDGAARRWPGSLTEAHNHDDFDNDMKTMNGVPQIVKGKVLTPVNGFQKGGL